MIRNASVPLAVISVMFTVQKYHNQTNTPPTETQQTPLENVRCGPTPRYVGKLVQTTYSTCGAIFSYPTSKHDYKVAIHDNQSHHNCEEEYQISHLKIL